MVGVGGSSGSGRFFDDETPFLLTQKLWFLNGISLNFWSFSTFDDDLEPSLHAPLDETRLVVGGFCGKFQR